MEPPRPKTLRQVLLRPMHGVWALLLALCCGFYAWWERPAKEGTATLQITLQTLGLPDGARAALWTGPTKAWRGSWDPGQGWVPAQGTRVAFPPRPLPLALRRFRQGMLLRRTHDLLVVRLETPDGTRRHFVYDLRDDLVTGMLRLNRPLLLQASCRWEKLKGEVLLPKEKDRQHVGY